MGLGDVQWSKGGLQQSFFPFFRISESASLVTGCWDVSSTDLVAGWPSQPLRLHTALPSAAAASWTSIQEVFSIKNWSVCWPVYTISCRADILQKSGSQRREKVSLFSCYPSKAQVRFYEGK